MSKIKPGVYFNPNSLYMLEADENGDTWFWCPYSEQLRRLLMTEIDWTKIYIFLGSV